jgi:mannitol 2-dehydrogenase
MQRLRTTRRAQAHLRRGQSSHTARYLEQLLSREAVPTLVEIPGHPAAGYADTVLERFANTGVRDQIARQCIDGTAKFPSS